MEIGKLRHRIEFLKKELVQTKTGNLYEKYTPYKKAYASIVDVSVKDFIQSQSQQSEITTRITTRYNKLLEVVDNSYRIAHNGEIYSIVGEGLRDTHSRREYITFACKRGVEK